jgi:hypothetical protein
MPDDSSPVKKHLLKDPFFYSGILVMGFALYFGWMVFSRWHENQTFERRAEEQRSEKQRESDRAAIEQLGGSKLAIQMFYASPPSVRRGEATSLCYGVANAKNVKLEPENNPVWPSHSRCVDVSPRRETTYTLTIDDGSGHSLSQSLTVKVR